MLFMGEAGMLYSQQLTAPVDIASVFRKHFGVHSGVDLQALSNHPMLEILLIVD